MQHDCRCCGKTVYTSDGFPIHTACIRNHWGKHARSVNASRCREFGKGTTGLQQIDNARFRQQINVIREGFEYELCAECGKDFDGHTIARDVLGNAQSICPHSTHEGEPI